jgi:outer membrane cobalamin receptor
VTKIIYSAAIFAFLGALGGNSARAGVDGSVAGSVVDPQGVAVSGVIVKITTPSGELIQQTKSSATGDFQFSELTIGDYGVLIEAPGFAPYHGNIHVTSVGVTPADVQLEPQGSKEMVLKVEAKRHLVQNTSSTSSTTMDKEQIATLPQGDSISLPRLLETTTAGVVQGPFGQMFIRGNHANIQYQIDGVQLPDSVSGTFADAFSPRNIDHYEIITGGIPAEYGEREAAVVNIVTKAGAETPGGSVELNYGTYNTFSPQGVISGSNKDGDIHYFLSANYNRTDRGLDTPQPQSVTNQTQGGEDAIHDQSNGNNEFMKIDWLPNNSDKLSFILFQNYNFYQIPNFPSSFSAPGNFAPNSGYFGNGYNDQVGNSPDTAGTPLFNYTPSTTNDTQANQDMYVQAVWKHTFNERSFLQVSPYWKYSKVKVTNDLVNDLFSLTPSVGAPYYNTSATPSSFALNQHVNNVGVHSDYTQRTDDHNVMKFGTQIQATQANDSFLVLTDPTGANPVTGGDTNRGYLEAFYAQDDWTINKQWSVNAGLRFSAFQFHFPDAQASDQQLQPRIGVNFMATPVTKLHVFYGRLFMPAPLENLREAFNATGGPPVSFYDIKAEKDNYFETGIEQQIGQTHVSSVNVYYKKATNMLDDTQLLNTSIASPYNYQDGYAYGIEYSLHGKVTPELSDYINYSYEIAKGENISGGTFAVDQNSIPGNTYLYLDHVQVHTANAGLTYAKDRYFSTVQGLFGSGLRTGPNNTLSLPSHFTFDLTAGYDLKGDNWLTNWKIQGDILNMFDNAYPITIANGFNGSHYAAGREFFIRLTKEL